MCDNRQNQASCNNSCIFAEVSPSENWLIANVYETKYWYVEQNRILTADRRSDPYFLISILNCSVPKYHLNYWKNLT